MPRRQIARAEIRRHGSEIPSRLRAGETLITIHDDLRARGAVSCAYTTFSRWVGRLGRTERATDHDRHDHPAVEDRH